MEEISRGVPRQRFTLTRKDRRVTVNYSTGDYEVLTFMAIKEGITITQVAHELFIMGLECKLHSHKLRLAQLEGKGESSTLNRFYQG